VNSVKPKTIEETKTFTQMVARKQGWVLTADSALYEDLVQGLNTNWNRYGYYLCPCRDTEGSKEADRDVVCPCDYAKEDIAEYGHCYCSLYWSESFAKSGKAPQGIPERRPYK
jgi:ferredoxin-thioredoxin reductase catalytic subunit